MAQFRRLRYVAASINLFGLILSAGTWAFQVGHPQPTLSTAHLIRFAWTVGVFCWLLGPFLFIATWIANSFTNHNK